MDPFDPRLLAYLEGVAFNLAAGYDALHELDDFVGQARLVWIEELAARPERADWDLPLIGVVVRRRLIDWRRLDYGRFARGAIRRAKPHTRTVSLDEPVHPRARLALAEVLGADDDFVEDLCDTSAHVPAEELIEAIVASQPVDLQPTARIVCEWIAEGSTLHWMGDQLGLTESRLCQLVKEIGRWAQLGDHVRPARWSAADQDEPSSGWRGSLRRAV